MFRPPPWLILVICILVGLNTVEYRGLNHDTHPALRKGQIVFRPFYLAFKLLTSC